MNCRNCGNALLENNPICPNCGFDNNQTPTQEEQQIPLNNESVVQSSEENYETLNDEFIELDDNEEKVEITENMAPPTLEVESENLAAGAGDLSNADSVSTYSPEEVMEQQEEEKKEKALEEEKVDFAIPSVQTPVEGVNMPTDGSAPEVKELESTVGDQTQQVQQLESLDGNKKKKFKISIPKGSKNVPKNLMIIVGIVFLIVGILLGKMFFSKNYCSVNNRNSVVSSNKKFVSDGKNNVTNVGNFTYKLPNSYIYDKKESGLLIYNKEDTFRIFIKGEKGSYQSLSGAKNSIKESLKDNSYTVNVVKEIKSLDVEFLVFETTTNVVNRMIAFADAGNGYVYYIEIVTYNNSYDYEVLEIAADILKNANYEEVETNMEKVEIRNISDISIKAAEEYANLIANENN